MGQLRFKLVDSVTSSAPLAAIYSNSGLGSRSIILQPGAVTNLRTTNIEKSLRQFYETDAYEEDVTPPGDDFGHHNFEGSQSVNGFHGWPFPWPVPSSDLYSAVASDLLVGPPDRNMSWIVSEPDGTAILCDEVGNIRVNDLRTGGKLPVTKFQYSTNANGPWQDLPLNRPDQYVRLLMGANQIAKAIPIISFTRYGGGSDQRLFKPVPTFTNWSFTNIGGNCVMQLGEDYINTFELLAKIVTWQNNPLNSIDLRIPHRNRHQPWSVQIKKASEFLQGVFVSTKDLSGSRPPVVTDEVPTFVNRSLLCLSLGGTKIFQGNTIADLETDWTTGIILKVNGEKRNDLIKDVLEEQGYVLLKQPIGRLSTVTVSYAVNPNSWVELSTLDLNPRPGHRKPAWMTDFTTRDSKFTFYVQSGATDQLLIEASARPNLLYHYNSDSPEAYTYMQGDRYFSLATVSIPTNSTPTLVDIRRTGGGLSDEDQKKHQLYDLKSHTGLGFYGGYPIKGNSVVITLPQLLFESLYRRYLDKEVNTVTAQVDNSGPTKVLTLSQKPYFDYTGYDWIRKRWTTQPITVTVTKNSVNYTAYDVTNYSNRTQLPALDPYASTGEYLFYYRDGKIYLNSKDFDSMTVAYNYLVGDEITDQAAHTAASDFIAEAVSRVFPTGTYLVLQYKDEKDFGPQAETRMQQYVYTTDDSGNLVNITKKS